MDVDTTKELPTVISFCAGYGGIERGLALAGIEHRVIAYVEIEAYAIENLLNKMEAGKLAPAPIWTDLKTFPAHLFRGAVDLIIGGYPCQPFSLSGERKGKEDPRHLWPYIREYVNTIKPARCFFENVEGHITLGLSSVISDLEEDGYGTAFGIFSAIEVGAYHRRKRVFIMADSDSTHKQGRWVPSGIQQEHKDLDSSSTYSGQCAPQQWEAEPRVARVANGCPNRVDRLRLLGNGVVPKTAAKAWQLLDERQLKQRG